MQCFELNYTFSHVKGSGHFQNSWQFRTAFCCTVKIQYLTTDRLIPQLFTLQKSRSAIFEIIPLCFGLKVVFFLVTLLVKTIPASEITSKLEPQQLWSTHKL